MLQPYQAEHFKFKVRQSVSIDNMNFKINLIELKETSNEGCSITIWGRKPNAVTFEIGRIFKTADLFWKSRKFTMETLAREKWEYYDFNESVMPLVKREGVIKLKSCSIYANTRLNEEIIVHTF